MEDKQIKSKERVAEHGEVFTADREVNAMLDLVKCETERIDSRFLEPACGEGAFLIKILERKLDVVHKQYKSKLADYEKYSIVALTSIYGVDILSDNAQACRDRLFDYWYKDYTKTMKSEASQSVIDAARYILNKNIIVGNALSLMCVDGNQNDTDVPITFCEWSMVMGTKIKRKDYQLDMLLKAEENNEKAKRSAATFTLDLFGDDISGYDRWMTDPKTHELVPAPIKEYLLTNYWEVQKYE